MYLDYHRQATAMHSFIQRALSGTQAHIAYGDYTEPSVNGEQRRPSMHADTDGRTRRKHTASGGPRDGQEKHKLPTTGNTRTHSELKVAT